MLVGVAEKEGDTVGVVETEEEKDVEAEKEVEEEEDGVLEGVVICVEEGDCVPDAVSDVDRLEEGVWEAVAVLVGVTVGVAVRLGEGVEVDVGHCGCPPVAGLEGKVAAFSTPEPSSHVMRHTESRVRPPAPTGLETTAELPHAPAEGTVTRVSTSPLA